MLDSVIFTSAEAVNTLSFDVSSQLVNPNATENTQRLMNFLTDIYGKYSLTGQYGDTGINSMEITRIYEQTGKYPAVLGIDLMEYSPSRVAHGSSDAAIEEAIEWYYTHGGIVTMSWHWNAPEIYLKNSKDQPWYKGFYAEAATINLTKIMNGEDKEGYDLLVSDIDAIAEQLLRLQDAGVPILWRPLHEASGGWFWWGACDAQSYIQLWNLMYDRLTNVHGLNNLIWVWNGQAKDWYPGDETVDIIGEDIYPGERVYTPQTDRFIEAVNYTQANKMIALTENGCLFDPDLAFEENSRWLFFGVWTGDFVLNKVKRFSDQYSEAYMWDKVYHHEKMITLDELPDLKKYRLED